MDKHVEDFVGNLGEEERRELLDFLHQCRYDCRRTKQNVLIKNLSGLLHLIEQASDEYEGGTSMVTLSPRAIR
jgi:hypothetical protein